MSIIHTPINLQEKTLDEGIQDIKDHFAANGISEEDINAAVGTAKMILWIVIICITLSILACVGCCVYARRNKATKMTIVTT